MKKGIFNIARFFNKFSGGKVYAPSVEAVDESPAGNEPTLPVEAVKDISLIFGQFAGREIPVKEETRTKDLIDPPYTVARFATPDDAVLQEMEKTAVDNGLELRFLLPGMQGIQDERTDRVCAYVEKAPDGKWRVSNRFEIG